MQEARALIPVVSVKVKNQGVAEPPPKNLNRSKYAYGVNINQLASPQSPLRTNPPRISTIERNKESVLERKITENKIATTI